MASNYQLQFILCYNVNYFQAEAKLISRNKFYGDMFKQIGLFAKQPSKLPNAIQSPIKQSTKLVF